MMQCDHERQAAYAQSAQHVAVTFQRVFIPSIRCWLNAAPLHRETMGILPAFCGAVKIFAPASAPPITGQTRRPLGMTFLFPLPPLVIRVVAFHLVRGGCSPP